MNPPPSQRPRYFISTVTAEFATLRKKVDEVLRFLGCDAETMDIWGTEHGDLRQKLRDKIDACDGLIQIVGEAYGAEPPSIDPDFKRISYTQFEFRYAQAQGKPTWLLFTGADSVRDKPLEELDLPRSKDHPDPDGYQAERRALQTTYRESLRHEGYLYHPFESLLELENLVLKLKDNAEEIQEQFHSWQSSIAQGQQDLAKDQKSTRKTTRRGLLITLASLFLVAALGAAGFVALRDAGESQAQKQKKILELQENPNALAAQQRARAVDDYEAKKKELLLIPDTGEREAKLADLDRLHNYALATIERLRMGNDATASPDGLELDKIMAEKGTDAALAFMKKRWEGILNAARHDEDSRKHLQVLLAGGRIAIDSGDHDLARALLGGVVNVDPSWTEARYRFWDFLFHLAGPRHERLNSQQEALNDYKQSANHADYLVQVNPANSSWQNAFQESQKEIERLSTEIAKQNARKILHEMDKAYQEAKATDTVESWNSFIANFGRTDFPETQGDDNMLFEARQRSSVLKAARDEKAAMAVREKQAGELRVKIARVSKELQTLQAEIDRLTIIFQDAHALINKLTNNKKTPVTEGSQKWFLCMEAAKKIKDVEAQVPALKTKRTTLQTELAGLRTSLEPLEAGSAKPPEQ